ncbi:MAG: hypothetical protein AAGF49_09745, partial [Pseudomonadota bacterium]
MSNPLVPSRPRALPPPGKAGTGDGVPPAPIPAGAALVRQEARQRRLPRFLRGWRLVGVLIALVLVGGLVRLSVAPLALPVSGMVADAISGPAGTDVRIGQVGVKLEWGALALTVDDVRVRTPVVSATVPRVNVLQGLSGRWVRLDGPAVRLNPKREASGGLALPHPDDALLSLDAGLGALKRNARAHGLRKLEIAGGRIDVYTPGRPITEVRVFRNVAATVDLGSADRVFAEASALGADGPISASIARIVEPDGTAIDIGAAGLSPKDFAPLKPVRDGLNIGASFSARLERAGVEAASLALDIGPGTFVFGRDPPRVLDEARIVLSRANGGDTLALDEGFLRAGPTYVRVDGAITPARVAGEPWAFSLHTTDAVFDAPEINAAPVLPRRIEAVGVLDAGQQLISVDRIVAELQDATLNAALDFDFSPAGPLLSGAARVSPSSIAA